MKVILEYDEATSEIRDNAGCMICSWAGLQHFGEAGGVSVSIETLVKLKNAGFTTDDIVELKRKELI